VSKPGKRGQHSQSHLSLSCIAGLATTLRPPALNLSQFFKRSILHKLRRLSATKRPKTYLSISTCDPYHGRQGGEPVRPSHCAHRVRPPRAHRPSPRRANSELHCRRRTAFLTAHCNRFRQEAFGSLRSRIETAVQGAYDLDLPLLQVLPDLRCRKKPSNVK
jgi:hypothetical protein